MTLGLRGAALFDIYQSMNKTNLTIGMSFFLSLGIEDGLNLFVSSETLRAVQVQAYNEHGGPVGSKCWMPRYAFAIQADGTFVLANWYCPDGYATKFLRMNQAVCVLAAA